MTQSPSNRFTFRTFILLLIPIILLVGVIVLFLSTGGGLNLDSAAPVENLDIERYVLKQGSIELQVRNTSPEEITIAQVIVNDAVMPASVQRIETTSTRRLRPTKSHWYSRPGFQFSRCRRRSVCYGPNAVLRRKPGPTNPTPWHGNSCANHRPIAPWSCKSIPRRFPPPW